MQLWLPTPVPHIAFPGNVSVPGSAAAATRARVTSGSVCTTREAPHFTEPEHTLSSLADVAHAMVVESALEWALGLAQAPRHGSGCLCAVMLPWQQASAYMWSGRAPTLRKSQMLICLHSRYKRTRRKCGMQRAACSVQSVQLAAEVSAAQTACLSFQ
jgi:hypothetical protein